MYFKMNPVNAENGNFGKLTYQPEGYKETIKYITTQPLETRKNGFCSKDASRRDEFANFIRTSQYRETIIKEKAIMQRTDTAELERLIEQRAKADMERSLNGTFNSTSSIYSEKVPQYDIGRNRITPFDPKGTKDRFYKFDDERPKRFGETPKPASYDIGSCAWETPYKPPSHGGKSEVKNFFDKSHLNVHSY